MTFAEGLQGDNIEAVFAFLFKRKASQKTRRIKSSDLWSALEPNCTRDQSEENRESTFLYLDVVPMTTKAL